jgi:hypothetical protein
MSWKVMDGWMEWLLLVVMVVGCNSDLLAADEKFARCACDICGPTTFVTMLRLAARLLS